MKYRIAGKIVAACILVLLSAALCAADTLRVQVVSSTDDAQEYLQAGCSGSRALGQVLRGDNYLEFGKDDCTSTPATLIGLRFTLQNIPRGAQITAAHLELVEDNASCGGGIDWTVRGENVDNAATFGSANFSISSRKTTNPTTASVNWANDKDVCNGKNSRTTILGPDIKAIIQEIVNRAGWSTVVPYTDSLALFVSGTGRRNVYSYDQKSSRAPLLHIEYLPVAAPKISVDPVNLGISSFQGTNPVAGSVTLTNTGNANLVYTITDDASWLSVSPASGTLAAGASQTLAVTYTTAGLVASSYAATITITDPNATNSPLDIPVSLTVQPAPHSSACGEVPLYTENLVNPAILILLDISGSMTTLMDLVDSSTTVNTTPDVGNIVQEIVNRGGWAALNPMNFILTGNGSGKRQARSYDNSAAYAPVLTVSYISSDDSIRYDNVEFPVVRSKDDAYQSSGGTMYLTNTTLQMGGSYTTGLRFDAVDIPPNSTILNASIRFVPAFSDTIATTVTVYGEAADSAAIYSTAANNITGRTKTTASASWAIPSWSPPTQESRLKIAKDVLSKLVADRSIAWGFGSWTGNYSSSDPTHYTKVHTGCKFNDDPHQTKLQTSIASVSAAGTTPLVPAMQQAQAYFAGTKADLEGAYYVPLSCQPKFLILITDGLGNLDTDLPGVTTEAGKLADQKITTVTIGFGLDDATQLNEIAKISNQRGEAVADDDLYAMHDEVAGVGVPFLAQNKTALEDALQNVTTNVKAQVFYGSTPAPTTSAGREDLIVNAQFSAGGWTGDLICTNLDTKNAQLGTQKWKASTVMPVTKKAYTVTDLVTNAVVPYTDATLASDNYLCKSLGDIINSTPVIIDPPTHYYPFNNYAAFRTSQAKRNTIIYVGSNDGALHAFKLDDGVEQWRFYPNSILAKLNEASDPTKNMCSAEFCHRYLVDGSPIAADIYDGSKWKTVLMTGLRRGGAAYFALDVTGGRPFDAVAVDPLNPDNRVKYLWQFTDSQLGQTWAQPEVYRAGVKSSTDTVWAVYWGSGYAEDVLNQPNKQAYLYGVEANDASVPLWKDATGVATNRIKLPSAASTLMDDALGGVVVTEMNDDYRGDRLYTGNLYGTMYRVTNIGKNETPQVSTLFSFNRGTPDHSTPIRVRPSDAYYAENITWLYFGTGSYEVQADKTTTAMQYFFGLRDDTTYPSYSLATLPIFTTPTVTNAATGKDFRVISGSAPGPAPYSWALELDNRLVSGGASERVISDALVVGGVVFFTTFTPAADVCEGTGQAWLFALDYTTGKPPAKPVFDINGDKTFDSKDMIKDASGNTYSVAGIYLGEDIASNPVLLKDVIVVGTKTGGTETFKVNLPRTKPAMRSWWENP